MSKCIKQANKRRRFESESNLCSALQEIERYSESRSFTASTLTYEELMKDLYSWIHFTFHVKYVYDTVDVQVKWWIKANYNGFLRMPDLCTMRLDKFDILRDDKIDTWSFWYLSSFDCFYVLLSFCPLLRLVSNQPITQDPVATTHRTALYQSFPKFDLLFIGMQKNTYFCKATTKMNEVAFIGPLDLNRTKKRNFKLRFYQ